MKATDLDLERELWLRRRNSGEITCVTPSGDEIPINKLSDSFLEEALKDMATDRPNIISV